MYPLLKYHGGKFAQKAHILSNFPNSYEGLTYVEPFLGGGSILLNKKQSKEEVAGDISLDLIGLWLHVKYIPNPLKRKLKIEYNEENFLLALQNKFCPEVSLYVRHRMSRGGLGKVFAKSNRLRGGQMGDKNAYESSIKAIDDIHQRIKDVTFLTCDFRETIQKYDDKNSFFYCDPPYLSSTRVSKDTYKYEMSNLDHYNFLVNAKSSKGKFLISGYQDELYNSVLKDWTRIDKVFKNSSGQNKIKQSRTECLWKNY